MNQRHRRSYMLAMTAIGVGFALLGILSWMIYQRGQLGTLQLLADDDGPYAIAEIFSRRGELLVRQTIPVQSPIELASGSYRISLARSARLSRGFQVFVLRGEGQKPLIDIEPFQLWPTLQLPRSYRLAKLSDRYDVISMDDDGFTRISGATGREMWRVDFSKLDSTKLSALPGFEWSWSTPAFDEGAVDRRPWLVEPAPDIDRDGTQDIVWAGRHQAWLAAFSGESGQLLWIVGRGDDTRFKQQTNVREYSLSAVHASPLNVGDQNGDRVPDLLVSLVNVEHLDREERWMELISGKSGETIWSYDAAPWLPDVSQFFPLTSGGTGHLYPSIGYFGRPPRYRPTGGSLSSNSRHSVVDRNHEIHSDRMTTLPSPPKLIKHQGTTLIAFLAGNHVVTLDLRTGAVVGTELELKSTPIWCDLPIWCDAADLDRDGNSELLVLARTLNSPPELMARSFIDKLWHWEHTLLSNPAMSNYPHTGPVDWPLIADLDGDGSSEIVIPGESMARRGASLSGDSPAPTGEIVVVDGRTGNSRWRCRVVTMHQQLDRFIVGPDINGDQVRDLFVATMSGNIRKLYVDALSGKDGDLLWWSSQAVKPSLEAIGKLRWWPNGDGSWPQLVVPVTEPLGTSQYRQSAVVVFSAGTGEIIHFTRGMDQTAVADANGDGAEDLLSVRHDNSRSPHLGCRLDAVRGGLANTWNHVGAQLTSAGDLDADGTLDLVARSSDQCFAVSGETGQQLWQSAAGQLELLECELASWPDDFDGDGINDLLLVDRGYSSNVGVWATPLRAISGRTGRQLWNVEPIARVMSGTYYLAGIDLEKDGRREIVFVHCNDWGHSPRRRSTSSGDAELWLAVVDARTGDLRWRTKLSGTAMSAGPMVSMFVTAKNQLRTAYGDVNQDGVLDVITSSDGDTPYLCVAAFSGIDGKMLWRLPRPVLGSVLVPEPVAIDFDSDGKTEIAVVDFTETMSKKATFAELLILDPRTGRPVNRSTWFPIGDNPLQSTSQAESLQRQCRYAGSTKKVTPRSRSRSGKSSRPMTSRSCCSMRML